MKQRDYDRIFDELRDMCREGGTPVFYLAHPAHQPDEIVVYAEGRHAVVLMNLLEALEKRR